MSSAHRATSASLALGVVAAIGLVASSACRPSSSNERTEADASPAVERVVEASSSARVVECDGGGSTHLADAPCQKNEDCVLTELLVECSACNTGTLYPATRLDVAARAQRCTPATTCIPRGCPPPDTYSSAFWRAECRAGKCVRFRWHTGG